MAVSGVAAAGVGTTAFGVRRAKLASTLSGDGDEVKKDEMKLYSAVALSMKTSRRDLSKASTGSFCRSV